jgi:hypothetical protein
MIYVFMQKHKFDINVTVRSINFYVNIYPHKFFIDIKNIDLAAARSIFFIHIYALHKHV